MPNPRHIALRVDASVAIGTGHVMRCLALADHLRSRGDKMCFIMRTLPGHLGTAIVSRGFQVIRLPAPAKRRAASGSLYQRWLGVPLAQDAAETGMALQGKKIDWLIVDHYALDARWEASLKKQVGRVMVIDDLANRPHACDLLLDQNRLPGEGSPYKNLTPRRCQVLLGPRFALLRKEFRRFHQRPRRGYGGIHRLLVFFGGVDKTNETEKTLQALKSLPNKNHHIDIIVGRANPNKSMIRSSCARMPNTQLHEQPHRIADLMYRADLAIGAAGVSAWERCCIGLPTLLIGVAENQRCIAETIHQAKAGVFLGMASQVTASGIVQSLKKLMATPDRVRALGRHAHALVDGLGCHRVEAYLT